MIVPVRDLLTLIEGEGDASKDESFHVATSKTSKPLEISVRISE
jgi:hypothetical protein